MNDKPPLADDFIRISRALEVALRNEREMHETLKAAQGRGTQLLERAREAERRIGEARRQLYEIKFQIDQGADAHALDALVSRLLDVLRDDDGVHAG